MGLSIPASPPSLAPLSFRSSSALLDLDERARDLGATGFVRCIGGSEMLGAVARHLERRARAIGRAVVRVDGVLDDPWRELCARLIAPTPNDPSAAAERVLERSSGALLVVVARATTAWGAAMEAALADAASGRTLVVVLDEPSAAPRVSRFVSAGARSPLDLGDGQDPRALRVFWDGLVAEPEPAFPVAVDRLEALEAWWKAARSTPVDAKGPVLELPRSARRLWRALTLGQRSLPAAAALRFGSSFDVQALSQAGVVAVTSDNLVVVQAPCADDAVIDAAEVAEGLAALGEADSWAAIRAAELFAEARTLDRAHACAKRAIESVTDPEARSDFWHRWEATLATIDSSELAPHLLETTNLALQTGDFERALRFARQLASLVGETYEAMLSLGRASVARGDVTTATIALAKAYDAAKDPTARARAGVEMAQAHYSAGRLAEAKSAAEAALEVSREASTRLQARNVLGKLLLATGSWAEAEHHFAADACDAACAGELAAELRAKINRAIALTSSGRREDAWALLQATLDEGLRGNELRIVGYALSNLGVIATQRHSYQDAMQLFERAIEVERRLGERRPLARDIANLAELRLRIGLVVEAEQALAFGRAACPAVPGAIGAHLALITARVHLARGATMEASAALDAAFASAASASNANTLMACHLTAARIALEDGDTARAGHALGHARAIASAPLSLRAECALLEAHHLRACGQPSGDAALEALTLAREGDNTEIAREAHALLHVLAVQDGDLAAARAHLESASRLRERTLGVLPEQARARFLARRELVELARCESAFRSQEGRSCDRCGDATCTGCAVRPAASVRSTGRIVGKDAAVVSLLGAIQKVGASDATVLIHGESGTGKELVAEALHEASARRSGPLVKVNCAALVETLLLSELFGHEKGAFTGASARRRGRFEMAEGGTLFLDEIGDISARTQVALLRVLQEKTFERVGGVTPLRANVRVVCATHRDLKQLVARGEFREDLYYRLCGVVLEVPALRSRMGDLAAIASSLLTRIAQDRGTAPPRLSTRALEGLARHGWPGNVRELENALRAAALFAEGDVIELEDFTQNVEGLRSLEIPPGPVTLPAGPRGLNDPPGPCLAFGKDSGDAKLAKPSTNEPTESTSPVDAAYIHIRGGVSLSDMKRQIERECIARALGESGGNITRAATLLGMKRPRLSQLVKQYGFSGGDLSDADSLDMEEG